MKVTLAALIAIAIGIAACTPSLAPSFPMPPAGGAILYAIEPGDGSIALYGVDSSAPEIPIAIARTSRITALLFPFSLASLELAPGAIPLVDNGRPLPPHTGAYVWDGASWSPVSIAASDPLAKIQIVPLDVLACVRSGGCLAGPDTDGVCTRPCPQGQGPEPPAVPMAPDFTASAAKPCRDGWIRKQTEDGPTYCDPPDLAPTSTCSMDQAQRFGDSGCRPIGAACGAGLFAQVLPSRLPILYVEENAAPNGDGSEAAPFATIREAISRAPHSGATIALSKGTFHESVTLPNGFILAGACALGTVVSGTIALRPAIVATSSATIRDLRVDGGIGAIDAWDPHGALVIRDVLVSEGVGTGARAHGDLDAKGLTIRGRGEIGIDVLGGSALVDDAVIEGIGGVGVRVTAPGRANLTRIAIRDSGSFGVFVSASASASIESTLLERTGDSSIVVQSATSTLTDVRIRDSSFGITAILAIVWIHGLVIERSETGAVFDWSTSRIEDVSILATHTVNDVGGIGMIVRNQSRASISRFHGADTADSALYVVTPSSSASIEDLVIERAGRVGTEGEAGLKVAQRANADVKRAVVTGCRSHGVTYDNATGSLFDVFITNSGHENNGGGLNVVCPIGGTCPVRFAIARLSLDHNNGWGIFTRGDCVVISGSDVSIHDTQRIQENANGIALDAAQGARIDLVRVRTEANARQGVHLRDPGSCVGVLAAHRIEDLIVSGSGPTTIMQSSLGFGLYVEEAATASITRAQIDHTLGIGIQISNTATLFLSDAAVASGLQTVMQVSDRGAAVLRRFSISGGNQADVLLESGSGGGLRDARGDADLELHDGTISSSPVGLIIRLGTPGFDLRRIADRVRFVGVVTPIEIE